MILLVLGCVSSPKYQTRSKPQLKWEVGGKVILESDVGMASYYGQEFAGRKTASGEMFNPQALTAAHNSYPFGTIVRVVNLRNNLSVVVRINDRGPFLKDRIIDLSQAAAERIGMKGEGTAMVRVEVLEWGKQP
jgi:rare lipoprotein A